MPSPPEQFPLIDPPVSHGMRPHPSRLRSRLVPGCSLVLVLLLGWQGLREPLPGDSTSAPTSAPVVAWHHVPELSVPLAQFATVFWEPRDTDSLRERIRSTDLRGRRVLEIGTGTGLVALTCLMAGAEQVVATDINPYALANARFNAERLGVADRLELRLVPPQRPGAYTVLVPGERFDLIVSNPPWEEGRPGSLADFALYDPGFRLLQSIIAGAAVHLKPEGRVWLAYGCVAAIRQLDILAPLHGYRAIRLDPRPLEELPPVFLPGMMMELRATSDERREARG